MFSDALNVLTTLKQKRPNDFRIKHNIALCTYALSGKTRTSEFQSKLSQFEAERKETKTSIFTLKYNQAVILFHQQQYKKSLDILNKLKDDLDAQTELKAGGMKTFSFYNKNLLTVIKSPLFLPLFATSPTISIK